MSLGGPNPVPPHVTDTMLHDQISAVLVATAAVMASSLLNLIWDAL